MDRQELYELWQKNKDRPAFVREYRDEIHAHTETSEPIPEGSLFNVREWLSDYKSVVTRQLNDESDDTDPHDEDDDADEEESEGETDA